MAQRYTSGPWTAYAMVHEETNEPMTPEQIGEYVKNTVIKSAKTSGTLQFLFVSAQKPDGPADVCHVGNGPTSPANAKLIAAAPDLLEALKSLRERFNEFGISSPWDDQVKAADAAIAKAEA